MIKNKTLRGLALAAAVSLTFAGLTAAPASAVGQTGLVTLAPDTGTEYTVIAKAGATFNLKANETSTAGNGTIKFLVKDTSGAVEPTINSTAVNHELSTTETVSATIGVGFQTVTLALGETPKMKAGDVIAFTATVSSTASSDVVASASPATYVVKSVAGQTVTFDVTGTAISATFSNVAIDAATTLKVLRSARSATTDTYVIDSGVNDPALVEKLELKVAGDTTRVVEVTAWKDITEDNLIDATEQVSPTRTVTFIKASELVTTTTLSVVPGDTRLTAKIKTTPVLNGQQLADDTINAAFTRQDSAKVFFAPQTMSASTDMNTSTWNDTAKEFSVTVSLEAGVAVVSSTSSPNTNAPTDSGLAKPLPTSTATIAKTSGSATITVTSASHNVRVGDRVTLGSVGTEFNVRYAVASVSSANVFTLTAATASGTITSAATGSLTVTTYTEAPSAQNSFVDRAFAGEYSAQAHINGVASGTKVVAAAIGATSAAIEFSTVGTGSVQGSSDGSAIIAKKGTLTVPVTISVLDEDEEAVSAGRPVVVSFTTGVTGVKVNDKTGSQTLTTDAAGQVTLNVTSPAGALGYATISATAENSATGTFQIQWVDQAFGLTDLNGTGDALGATETRAIVAGGSHTMNLTVMNQWYAAAAAGEYRVLVTGAGTTQGVKTLVDGKTEVTITDNGFESAMSTTIALQKLTSGTWANVAGKSVAVTTNVNKNVNSVVLAADGSSLYGSAADLSAPVAVKSLVAADYRLTTAAQPAYSWSALVAGKVQNAGTSVGVNGAEVTITGPSSILFSNGSVDKIGSITVLSDASGHFSFSAISTTAQKDTVLTVTSLGKSATTKVTFTGTTTGGVGTTLVITAPDTVAPASTLQVKAKLTDSFGNAVASAPVRVTYTGPGIAFGALPTAVDALGELSFSVLLGGGDTGTITVVVSYDQNGDGDYVDAKDLNTTKVITVGAAAAAPATDQKLTVGSFKGFVAIYALNYTGQKLSAKVAGKWLTVNNLSRFQRVVRNTGAAIPIVVDLYIDGKFVRTENIVTK
jgi:hypothetical protein